MRRSVRFDPAAWRSQDRLAASITSLRQLQVFNDRGGIAVNFDILRSIAPDIAIAGSQSESLSFWETRSASGFVTKPKFNAELVTVRFISHGRITYRQRSGDAVGTPSLATLIGFEDLHEVQASGGFHAVSATIAVDALVAAEAALTGGTGRGLQPLAPVADMAAPGMRALFLTLRQVQARSAEIDLDGDLVFPLVKEIMSYQLLSSWPKRDRVTPAEGGDVPIQRFQIALDYIEANLSRPLMLSDIAAASGIGVRALQDRFRAKIGCTPLHFIIDRRLRRVHQDLTAGDGALYSVSEIARRWGFVHMSDFGQRYRRLYGCAPSETQRAAHDSH